MLIDGKNIWFGPRSFIPFSSHKSENSEQEKQKLLEIWKNLKKGFLSLNKSELNQLSDWFQNLEDSEKCEIIDLLVECEEFKKVTSLTGSGGGLIKDHFRINLSKLNDLAYRNWEKKIPKFSDFFGRNSVLFISRLNGFESKFGKLLDIWIEKEVNKELKNLDPREINKVNGIQIIKTLFSGKKYWGEGCESYKNDENERKIFSECITQSKKTFRDYPSFEGENYFTPEIIDVIKGGYIGEEGEVYSPSKYVIMLGEQYPEEFYGTWKKAEGDTKEILYRGFEDNGSWKGVIDIGCSNVRSSDWFSSFLQIVTKHPIEKIGCWEFYNLLFTKENVPEKRFCLFKLPETKSFIKEISFLDLIKFSTWKKGNSFWTRCSTYEI
ncbi:hypothetical protein [Mycoplasma suis]|uniref:Uncharacterized protein n=1 Tax=Mycoplasma suis (strain Illinois) TaxID=768700 RepID=F0QRF6_MYCSL|nr:hypothetical protein [Mycoplasma suis]ADX98076.1 hypothetical protein MSU_0543 [Mycoplasma suis str. Illinois]